MTGARRGAALVATIGVLSLMVVLAVATLSLGGRAVQGSSLAVRDSRLDAAAGFGLGSVWERWRADSLGTVAVGTTRTVGVETGRVPVSLKVTITRLSAELFWVVSESTAPEGSARRENVVLRLRLPDVTAILGADSSDITSLGILSVDSISASADRIIEAGSQVAPPSGVVHSTGDLSLSGGSAEGILVVDGRLTILGPLTYRGIIIAKGGISVVSPEVTISGLVRAAGNPGVAGVWEVDPSHLAVQDVLYQSLIPRQARGRSWAELH